MQSKKGIFYGIELDKKNGRYDGSFLNKKYFECDTRKGLFITINDIDKLIKKSKTHPRVTINCMVYVNKYNCNGIIKYIGIPFTEKNKSKNVYYGIELNDKKGKNNGCIGKSRYFMCDSKKGVFTKKDGFEYTPITPNGNNDNIDNDDDDDIVNDQDIIIMADEDNDDPIIPTPGGPSDKEQEIQIKENNVDNTSSSKSKPKIKTKLKVKTKSNPSERKGRKQRKDNNKKKKGSKNVEALSMKRSHSINAKTKKKLKKKVVSKTFSKSRPSSPEVSSNNVKLKQPKIAKKKRGKKFKRNGKKKLGSRVVGEAKSTPSSPSKKKRVTTKATSKSPTKKKSNNALKPNVGTRGRSKTGGDINSSKARTKSATPTNFKKSKKSQQVKRIENDAESVVLISKQRGDDRQETKDREEEENHSSSFLTTPDALSPQSPSSPTTPDSLTTERSDESNTERDRDIVNDDRGIIQDEDVINDRDAGYDRKEEDNDINEIGRNDGDEDGKEDMHIEITMDDEPNDFYLNGGNETDNATIDSSQEAKGEDDFYDEDYHDYESVNSLDINAVFKVDEQEAIQIINDTLSIKNYRLFLQCIQPIKDAVMKLDKSAKRKILNHTQLQCHENNLMIWQNILHLALFIVKSMHSFYNLSEKKSTWDFVDFLLQNGSDPLIRMTIKQDSTYEHKNVFRLMNEALNTYKQNQLLIVKRFTWLWSLVEDDYKLQTEKNAQIDVFKTILSDDEDDGYDSCGVTNRNNGHRLTKPAILTFDATLTTHWIVADAYDQLPEPDIIKEYLDFGADLVHFCGDDTVYYDFNQIRMSLPPNLIITNLRISEEMRFNLDLIGRLVLYYKYYFNLRCKDIESLYNGLRENKENKENEYPALDISIIEEIISYTNTNICYIDDELQEIDLIGYTLCGMPSYSRNWNDWIYKNVISNLEDKQKLNIKKLTKKWENDNEWDYWLSNLKNKQQFLCYIDLFEHVIGYKTAQKITNYYMKKHNSIIIQQFMENENAFKYLELYNLLYQYDLTRNESAKYIFKKLIDLVTNRKKCDRKQSARKELTNLYVQFCRHQVNDWMFQNNFLYILKQLLPENQENNNSGKGSSGKSNKKKSKKPYRFDFAQAILHCYKAGQLNTLAFLMDNKLLINVERALRLFYIDDVIKRIIFGMDEFDEKQEDFLKLILNWTWQYTKNKNDMQTWYQKWLKDAQLVEDEDCCEIFEHYCNLSNDDNMV